MSIPHLPFLTFLSGALALEGAPALCDDKSEGWMRYGELRAQIKNLIPFWHTPTLEQKRGLILCAVPRTISGMLAYLSATASGHAILLIDPTTARPDQFIAHYEPELILLPSALRPDGPYIPVDFPLGDLFLWQRTMPASHAIHDDLFLLLLPPGPSESFKTVRLSYSAIAHNTQASIEALGLNEKTRPLLVMPLAYSFGLSILHMTLSVGGSLAMSELDLKNRELWDFVQRRDVTLFAGVPFHFEYMTRAKLDNLHVPRLKTFLQAGGRMPTERTQELLSQVLERKGELFILYGQTEASPRIACLPLHLNADKIGSIGKVIAGGHISNEASTLTYHGPNVMMGYAQSRADLINEDTQLKQLALADQGHTDEDGFWFLNV